MPRHGHPTAPTPAPPAPQPAAATVRHVVDVNLNVNVTGLADVFGGAIRDTLSQVVSTLQSQDQNMADIKAELQGIKADVATLHTAVTGAAGRLNDLTATVADLTAKLAANPSDDPEVQQLVADIDGEGKGLAGELSGAAGQVTPPTDTGTTTTTDQTQPPATDQGGAPAA
jgi:ABC-type transporter Mla subunit MlaD